MRSPFRKFVTYLFLLTGGLSMEISRAAPPDPRAAVLTRALCLLVVLLMTVAGVYGAFMALRYFRQIGV